MQNELDTAVANHVTDTVQVPVIVARYVVVADVILPDGNRMLSRLPSDGASMWDIHGMLGLVQADIEADFVGVSSTDVPDVDWED